jgi:catalase
MRRFAGPMFAASATPVRVRFSVMNGGPAGRDIGPNNLGLAVRFDEDGGDLIAVNAALFPAKSPAVFQNDFLTEVAGPTPSIITFLERHKDSIAATIAYGRSRSRGRPPSFAETTYHGQHAFWLTSTSNDRTLVRYRFAPTAGDRGGRKWDDPASMLRDELLERLKGGPVHFRLMLEVAGYGQHADDPSEFWPETLERLIAGELVVRSPTDPPPAGAELLFRPDGPPAGWEPVEEDAVMNARREVYALARNGA